MDLFQFQEKKIKTVSNLAIHGLCHSYITGLKNELQKMYPVQDDSDSMGNDEQVFHIYYKVNY